MTVGVRHVYGISWVGGREGYGITGCSFLESLKKCVVIVFLYLLYRVRWLSVVIE